MPKPTSENKSYVTKNFFQKNADHAHQIVRNILHEYLPSVEGGRVGGRGGRVWGRGGRVGGRVGGLGGRVGGLQVRQVAGQY